MKLPFINEDIFEPHKSLVERGRILLYIVLDSSHVLCACNNALFYLFVSWFSVIMIKSDI